MNARSDCADLELIGLDGSNPLGFLAALGALLTVRQSGEAEARLAWKHSVAWVPFLTGVSTDNPKAMCKSFVNVLRGNPVQANADARRVETQQAFDATKKSVKDKLAEIKKRGLRGNDRKAAVEAEIGPLKEDMHQKRQAWLAALKGAVPRGELAIGKHIDCTGDEYRIHAVALLENAERTSRESVDLLAAFASDACLESSGRITATPFCFITGSGHQYFLDTVRQLLDVVTPERVHAALFEPWAYRDEKLSMRWDPLEDRRYALMDRDPTASDNKSRTVWMANLLAYRALVLFPSAPTGRRLFTTAWTRGDGPGETANFTWPIWERPANPDTIRSLLQLRELHLPVPDRSVLRARGITAAFRTRRIQIGRPPLHKINFSPARGV